MTQLPDVNIIAINIGQSLALTATEEYGDIRGYLDEHGDECELDEAAQAVIEWRAGGWSVVVLDDYDFGRKPS